MESLDSQASPERPIVAIGYKCVACTQSCVVVQYIDGEYVWNVENRVEAGSIVGSTKRS